MIPGVERSALSAGGNEWLALSVKLRSMTPLTPLPRRGAGSDIVLRVRIRRGCLRLTAPAQPRLIAWARARVYGWLCQ